jgi:hypothetical protein
MWMRIAWKVRVAGMRFLVACAASAAAIRSRQLGGAGERLRRPVLHDGAGDPARCFSSPQVHSTSAISFSSARASHSAALSPESGSMRMSSGPSLPN